MRHTVEIRGPEAQSFKDTTNEDTPHLRGIESTMGRRNLLAFSLLSVASVLSLWHWNARRRKAAHSKQFAFIFPLPADVPRRAHPLVFLPEAGQSAAAWKGCVPYVSLCVSLCVTLCVAPWCFLPLLSLSLTLQHHYHHCRRFSQVHGGAVSPRL